MMNWEAFSADPNYTGFADKSIEATRHLQEIHLFVSEQFYQLKNRKLSLVDDLVKTFGALVLEEKSEMQKTLLFF